MKTVEDVVAKLNVAAFLVLGTCQAFRQIKLNARCDF